MGFSCTGLNHTTAGVEIREKLALKGSAVREAIGWLKQQPGIQESFLLSTCNRVEFYLFNKNGSGENTETIRQLYREKFSLPDDAWNDFLFQYEQEEAVTHLFRVTSGMESMVIGEPQITGQVKEAYRLSLECGSGGPFLNRLMHRSFTAAKRVRTDTELGARAVSVSYVAVELARKIFDDLRGRTVLLAGAGEMAELTARHLTKQGVERLFVASRTLGHAQELASCFGGHAMTLDRIGEVLPEVDILVCSTAAPGYILNREEMRGVMRSRRQRPVFLIDISVPRNIDPEAGGVENVYLYDMDDLQNVLQANLAERKKELAKAERIIREEVGEFLKWVEARELVPTIASLRQNAEAIRRGEVEKAFSVLKDTVDEKQKRAIEALSRAIVNKLLHDPISQLKQAEREGDSSLPLPEVHHLFSLPWREESPGPGSAAFAGEPGALCFDG
jgi:glutamyl-tRNA reductase